MKRIIYFGAITLLGMVSALGISSCNSDESVNSKKDDVISPDIIEKFTNLGFDAVDMQMVDGNYLLEGDIIVTPEALANMTDPIIVNGANGEQYKTYNLVSSPRTINIKGKNLSSQVSKALDDAIDNYNALNIGLTLKRVTKNADIVVKETGSSAGGVSGFPYGNGNPYNSVTIYGGTKKYSPDVVEHVVTHELGHCLGLRHTDWFNRSYSCGKGGSEGTGSDGAVHIPNTPTQYDPYSIMNACFSGKESGEFSGYDIIAIEYLY